MIAKVRLRELATVCLRRRRVLSSLGRAARRCETKRGEARRVRRVPSFPFALPLSLLQDTRVDNLMENCELQSASAPIFHLVSLRFASSRGQGEHFIRALFIYVKHRHLYIFYPPCNQLYLNDSGRCILDAAARVAS